MLNLAFHHVGTILLAYFALSLALTPLWGSFIRKGGGRMNSFDDAPVPSQVAKSPPRDPGDVRLPHRVQRQRTRGWRMPPNTVYVGRPTQWGNQFTGQDAATKYRNWLRARHWLSVQEWIAPLRGQDLACWCPLDQPCHADVLLEFANRATQDGGR